MKNASKTQNLKKIICFVMSCLVFLTVFACTSTNVTISTVPLAYTDDQRVKIEILGEILLESKDRVGYIGLLKAARNLYPDCDYVIDIMIDQRITTTTETKSYGLFSLFIKAKQSVNTEVIWIMRGTAIKYAR